MPGIPIRNMDCSGGGELERVLPFSFRAVPEGASLVV